MVKTSIRVFSPDHAFLGEVDDYSSLRLERRYFSPGEFELHIALSSTNASTLQKRNVFMLGGNPNKVGYVLHREVALNEDGREVVVVKGPTLSGILRQRMTVPPVGQGYDTVSGVPAETAMKHYVSANAVLPVDVNRVIPQLVLAADQGRGQNITWQTRFKALDEELAEIGAFSGLGWHVVLDIPNQRWLFDVVQGRDLTVNQSELSQVVFSVDYDNVSGQRHIDSILSLHNVGYVGGQGEGAERVIVEAGEDVGLERHEVFIDARDLASGDADPPLTEEQIEALLLDRGQQKLLEMAGINSFEASVMPSGSFIYGQDWDLGDIVTVRNRKWGLTMDARISEVTEVYEAGGMQVLVTFGNSIPTLLERLRQKLNLFDQEVRR